jgi:hypothetical protein
VGAHPTGGGARLATNNSGTPSTEKRQRRWRTPGDEVPLLLPVLFVNKQGQTQLARYYEHLSLDGCQHQHHCFWFFIPTKEPGVS